MVVISPQYEQTYNNSSKTAIIGYLKKKKIQTYSGGFKTIVIGPQYEQTYSDDSKTAVIRHLKYKINKKNSNL